MCAYTDGGQRLDATPAPSVVAQAVHGNGDVVCIKEGGLLGKDGANTCLVVCSKQLLVDAKLGALGRAPRCVSIISLPSLFAWLWRPCCAQHGVCEHRGMPLNAAGARASQQTYEYHRMVYLQMVSYRSALHGAATVL